MAFSADVGVSPALLDQASLRDAKTEPSILNEALPQLPPELPSVLRKLVKWGDFAAVGTPIHPTRFVPCKTPLSRQILENWTLPEPPMYPLTVPQLLGEQQALGRRVGLILDLSNHDCLYTDDIPPSVRYTHIQLVAKELPPCSFVNEVQKVANAFWAECPDQFIAVHCAYGFNRTGFIMASYLVQQYGLSVDAALQAFREARPPGVRHAHFTAELRRRYELHTSHTCASPQPHPALAEAAGAEEAPAPQPSPALMSGWLREAAGQGGYAATPGSLLGARSGGSGSARQRLSGRLLVVEGDGEGGGSRVVMIEKNESLDLSLAQVELLQSMSRNPSDETEGEAATAGSGSSRRSSRTQGRSHLAPHFGHVLYPGSAPLFEVSCGSIAELPGTYTSDCGGVGGGGGGSMSVAAPSRECSNVGCSGSPHKCEPTGAAGDGSSHMCELLGSGVSGRATVGLGKVAAEAEAAGYDVGCASAGADNDSSALSKRALNKQSREDVVAGASTAGVSGVARASSASGDGEGGLACAPVNKLDCNERLQNWVAGCDGPCGPKSLAAGGFDGRCSSSGSGDGKGSCGGSGCGDGGGKGGDGRSPGLGDTLWATHQPQGAEPGQRGAVPQGEAVQHAQAVQAAPPGMACSAATMPGAAEWGAGHDGARPDAGQAPAGALRGLAGACHACMGQAGDATHPWDTSTAAQACEASPAPRAVAGTGAGAAAGSEAGAHSDARSGDVTGPGQQVNPGLGFTPAAGGPQGPGDTASPSVEIDVKQLPGCGSLTPVCRLAVAGAGVDERFTTASWVTECSENESLGATERIILEGLRDVHLTAQGAEAELEGARQGLLAASGAAASPSPNACARLKADRRVGVDEIEWPHAANRGTAVAD